MRILHVIPSVAPRYGGPSAAVHGMGRALAQRGHDVAVATTDADGPGRMPVPLGVPVDRDGVRYRYFGRTLPGEYKVSLGMTRWLAAHVRDFDVVHVHALFSYATIPGSRLARRAGVPYVLRPLGTLGAWGLRQKSWKKAPYLALVERAHLAHAAAIHATSEAEAESVAALGYGASCRVIPLGVDVVGDEAVSRRLATASADVAETNRRPLRVLFLSRLHEKKGLPLLFEAVGRADPSTPGGIELTVAGDGDPAYVSELRRLASRVGARHPIRFVGQVAGAEKAAAFQSSDLFALASSDENFGIAAAEALAWGVPTLLSEGVAIGREVAAAGAGVTVPLSTDAFAGALVSLAADEQRRRSMSWAALSFARATYSWERTAERLEQLYGDVTR